MLSAVERARPSSFIFSTLLKKHWYWTCSKKALAVYFDKLRFLQHNLPCEKRLFGPFRKIITSSVFKNEHSAEPPRALSTEEWPEAVGLDPE